MIPVVNLGDDARRQHFSKVLYADKNVTTKVCVLDPAVTFALSAVIGVVTTRRALLATAVAKLENQVAAVETNVDDPV
jgi:hypothetical protein